LWGVRYFKSVFDLSEDEMLVDIIIFFSKYVIHTSYITLKKKHIHIHILFDDDYYKIERRKKK